MKKSKFENLHYLEEFRSYITTTNTEETRYRKTVEDAENLIRKRHKDIDWTSSIDDKETYKLLCDGRIFGVFPKRSKVWSNILRKLKPEVFTDFAALMALNRPCPLGGGMVDDFIRRKHGKVPIKNIVPQLDDILKETYGVILYQEQVIRIAKVIGGFDLDDRNELMMTMSEKKQIEMAQQRGKFVKGAAAKGIPRDKADKIFDLIEHFAGWVVKYIDVSTYAINVLRCAYIKAHYPLEFFIALIINYADDMDMVSKCIDEIKEVLTVEIRRNNNDH